MELGEIPVRIDLYGYQISQSPKQNMLRLEKGMHGEAWISYHEHDFSDAIIEGKSSQSKKGGFVFFEKDR
jgi:hypothetical protein